MFHVFFPKTRVDRSTGTEENKENSPRRMQTFSPPCRFSLNAIVIKINPLDIKRVTFVHVARNSSHGGNTSPCNCEARIASLALPGVKNMSQSTKIAVNDGTISVMVTKFVIGEEGRRHPPQQDSRPLPKTHPDTTLI